jgi:O-antigen ligase
MVSTIRMLLDRRYLEGYTTSYLVSEYLINCVKWVLPALLLYDGCRTKKRLKLAVGCILGLYLLLAVQVIKYMPLSAAMSGDDMNHIALKICSSDIGYHRVNLSMLLSGASWAMLALLPVARKRWQKVLVLGAFVLVAYAQALTGGRMGYVTWGLLGVILCALRWRRMLLLAPVVPLVIAVAMPGVAERMLQGFGQQTVTGETTVNQDEVTSDRARIWPVVISGIMESPVVGHGRLAMVRTGLAAEYADLGFPHPHNAYLEWLLDNGLIGFLLVMPFYLLIVVRSTVLFLDKDNPTTSMVGGVCLALTLALLIAAMGSQTFYPREGAVGMWAAFGIMLRYHVLRARALAPAPAAGYPSAAQLATIGARG